MIVNEVEERRLQVPFEKDKTELNARNKRCCCFVKRAGLMEEDGWPLKGWIMQAALKLVLSGCEGRRSAVGLGGRSSDQLTDESEGFRGCACQN